MPASLQAVSRHDKQPSVAFPDPMTTIPDNIQSENLSVVQDPQIMRPDSKEPTDMQCENPGQSLFEDCDNIQSGFGDAVETPSGNPSDFQSDAQAFPITCTPPRSQNPNPVYGLPITETKFWEFSRDPSEEGFPVTVPEPSNSQETNDETILSEILNPTEQQNEMHKTLKESHLGDTEGAFGGTQVEGDVICQDVNNYIYQSLLLRECLNLLLRDNVHSMTEDEYDILKYHISLLNKVAHPKEQVTRKDIVKIYDAKIRWEPKSFSESHRDTVLSVYDRMTCKDIHVCTLHNVSRYESMQIFKDEFSHFGSIDKVTLCGGDIHMRFCSPEAVSQLCKKQFYPIEYTGVLQGVTIHCKQNVSVQRVYFDMGCKHVTNSSQL